MKRRDRLGVRQACLGLKAWWHEAALRRRLGNVGHLMSGNVVSGLVAVGAAALAARALGASDYGVLAMVVSFARAIERLVTFQSWQPLIKYGAELEGPEHRADLKMLLKFGLMLDIAGAALAWLIATAIALAGGWLFDWNSGQVAVIAIYCLQLLFNINGTPTAVLRLYGRFRSVAYVPLLSSVVRLVCCAIGVVKGAGIEAFILIWMGTNILGWLALLVAAFRELRRQGIDGLLRTPLSGVTRRFPGIWGFAWSTNLSLTIRTSAQELDTLLVGTLADPASAGLYHIAKRFGRITQQVGVHVQAVLYPDVARLWAKGAIDALVRAVRQVEVLLAACGTIVTLALIPIDEWLLTSLAGPDFAKAAPLLIAQMVAVTLSMTGFGARSALLAMGRQQRVLMVVLVATAAFHVTALLLIPVIGAMGANIAHIVLGLVWLVGLNHDFRRTMTQQRLRKQGDEPVAMPVPTSAT